MRDYPVPFETWEIGMEFWMNGERWRVTDVGKRTIVAISLEPHEVVIMNRRGHKRTEMVGDPSWHNGPPYAVVEHVMDEDNLMFCYLGKPDDGE